MGCAGSRAALYKKLSQKPEFRVWSKKFDALCIHPSEVKKLFYVFAKADFDGGGTIDLIELLTAIDLERTPFTERVFAIFDDDNSGKIDFGEFVLALWNYCTLSNVTLGESPAPVCCCWVLWCCGGDGTAGAARQHCWAEGLGLPTEGGVCGKSDKYWLIYWPKRRGWGGWGHGEMERGNRSVCPCPRSHSSQLALSPSAPP